MAAPVQEAGARRHVERYVLVLASLAAISYGVALAVVFPLLSAGTILIGGGVVVLAALLVAFRLWGFELEWRGHRMTLNLEEAILFIAFLHLPPPVAVLAVGVAEIGLHVHKGREGIKGLFNVAHNVLAAAAAALTFVVVERIGAPPILAAIPAVLAFVLVSHLSLACVLARLERVDAWRVFTERLAPSALLVSVVGVAGGMTAYALLTLHPVALLCLVPFVHTLKRNTVLASRADRELNVHRRLGEVSLDLVGTSNMDAVAERVLDTCHSVLDAERAVLRLEPERDGSVPRVWTSENGSSRSVASTGFVVDLPGRDGLPIGALAVHPGTGAKPFGDIEEALARIVAGQAASAIQNARALSDLEDAREAAIAQHERLAKQEKLSTLGMLIANVSHEVGNPLSFMRASLELSIQEAERLSTSGDGIAREAGDRLLEDLSSALTGAHRIAEIAESLKSVARQGPRGFKPTNINDVARDVANVVRVGLPRTATLDIHLTDKPVMVNANGSELTQVLLNLVKNAAEAIGHDVGRVAVRTRLSSGRVLVDVEDDGPGIPEDLKARLFEQFFTTKEKGTGLGLNISRGIVEAHGGELRVESTAGKGTTFTIDLPAIDDEAS